jgi:hypothetical protein
MPGRSTRDSCRSYSTAEVFSPVLARADGGSQLDADRQHRARLCDDVDEIVAKVIVAKVIAATARFAIGDMSAPIVQLWHVPSRLDSRGLPFPASG